MTCTPEQITYGMDDMWANNLPDILSRVRKDQENGRFDPRVTVWLNEDTNTIYRAALAKLDRDGGYMARQALAHNTTQAIPAQIGDE